MAVVGQVANLSEASRQVGNLSYGDLAGDTETPAGYNILPADSARWPFDAADTDLHGSGYELGYHAFERVTTSSAWGPPIEIYRTGN